MDRINEWINNAPGRRIDVDGSYGLQCLTKESYIVRGDGSQISVANITEGEQVISSSGGINTVVSNKPILTSVYRVKTDTGIFKASAEHLFQMKDGTFKEAKKIQVGDEIRLFNLKSPQTLDLTDDELRFLGFWLGDGTKNYRWKGSKIPAVFVTVGSDRKRQFLDSLNVELNMYSHSDKKASQYHVVNKQHPQLVKFIHELQGKELPINIAANQTQLILDGYLQADAYEKRPGVYIATSTNRCLALTMQQAAIACGYKTSISEHRERSATNLCEHPSDITTLYINKNKQPSGVVKTVELLDEQETVYLLELDGDKTYVADNHCHHNCKDVIDDYCLWLFNDWVNTIRPANAKEAFANSNEEYFEKIVNNPNDPNLIPQRGDIIIWGAMSGNPYGHIAVVAGADTNGVDVIEQDGFLQVPARLYRRPYVLAGGAVIGWLRPRPEKIIGYTPEPISGTARKTSSTVNARDDSNTSSNIFQEIDPNQVVDMKGYVTDGESVNGDTVWYVTARSGKYMSRQLFEDKDLHDLPDLTPKDNIQGYQRKAVESGVRARKAPNTSSDVAQIINGNTIIDMKAWCRGESIENNDVWFISKENALYLWSGAFTDTSTHDLPELVVDTPQPEKEPEIDYSKQIIDISNYQNEKVVDIFPKIGGVIVKTGWVGEKFGGNEFKLDPRAKLFTDKAREAGKLLGFYWLPYFSTREEAEQNAEYFVKCIEALGNQPGELLFIDLEPDFEGTAEQIAVFSNIVLQKTGKQVFTYAGESIIKKLGLERVDWYPNYGNPGNYAHGSFIHQYTESGTIPGYDGKLDMNVTSKSIEEIRSLAKITTVNKQDDKPINNVNEKQGEKKVATPIYTKDDIKAIEEMNRQALDLAKNVSESDEVQDIVKGISKRTKLTVYFIGDGLIGLGIIIPQLAVALQLGTLEQVSALSGVCAAAGAFLLTMFGIYKDSK